MAAVCSGIAHGRRSFVEQKGVREMAENRECKIKYIANAVLWRDKVNGNTYHSVRVTRTSDGEMIVAPFQGGYGEHYKQTALAIMLQAGWLPDNYNSDNVYLFERENNYPIYWSVRDGLKWECMSNGIL